MLINVHRDEYSYIPNTPFIQDARLAPYIGKPVAGPNPKRRWTIQSFLRPPTTTAIQGVRARLQDQKGFITFCNQRDLEVLLGEGSPGDYCPWLGRPYVEPLSDDWIGFYASEEDLRDDLFETELLTRYDYPLIPTGTSFTRRVHVETGVDVLETYVCIGDWNTDTGESPDPAYSSVTRRWVRAERTKTRWDSEPLCT